MARNDRRHPHNDCKYYVQLEPQQARCIEQIVRDTGMTKSKVLGILLKEKIQEYMDRVAAISREIVK